MDEESPALVGREPALVKLTGLLERAEAGRGGAILLEGEAGIGKSRLLEELAGKRAFRGGVSAPDVVWGRAWEAGGAPAYWPWVEALRGLCRRRDGLLGRLPPSRRALLGQLAPEFAHAQPSVFEVPADKARFLLLDALAATLCDAAHERPLLVLLEDMHVADADSLLALELVATSARASALLVVASLRPSHGEERAALLGRIERVASKLSLPRLTRAEVCTLAQHTLTRPVGEEETDELLRRSEGNPLFVVELARLVAQRSAARESVLGPQLLPKGVRAIVEQRIEQLTQTTQEVLAAAAVLGREFDERTLSALVDDEAVAVSRAVTEALEAHVLEREGARTLRFTHILLRDALYACLAESERADVHRRVADLLTRATDALAGGPPFPLLAHHLARAGAAQSERAIEAATRAAEHARTRLAFEEATHWLAEALRQHERLPAGDPRRTLELSLALARVRNALGDVAGSRALCMRAVELARRERAPELLSRAALEYGRVFVFAATDVALVQLLDEALVALPTSAVGLRARLLARRAAALQPAIEPELPIQHAREALALARTVDEPETLLETLRAVTSTMADLGDPRERAELNRELAALAQRLGEPLDQLRGLTRLTHDLVELGDLAEARTVVLRASALAEHLDAPFARWIVLGLQAMLATYAGDFARAHELAEAARESAVSAHDPNAERSLALSEVMRWLLQGEVERACSGVPALRRAMDDVPFMSQSLELLEETLHLVLTGERPALREEVVQLALASGDACLLSLATLHAYLRGDATLAARIEPRLAQRAGRLADWGAIGLSIDVPVDSLLALLQLTQGHLAQAGTLLESALALTRRTGGVRHEAWTLSLSAELARLHDDETAATELDGKTRALCEAHGFSLFARRRPATVQAAASASTVERAPTLVRTGELWTLRSRFGELLLEDSKGMRYLAMLLDQPGRGLHVVELIGAHPAERVQGREERLDRRALDAYRARTQALREQLEEAEQPVSGARALALREELEAIEDHLSTELGLGGRSRRVGSPVERARVNVQRRIRDALKRVEQQSPELGRELARAVRTGTVCSYEP